MTNPDIANQNRRRAASWPVFKLGITMRDPRHLLVRLRAINDFDVGHIHDIRSTLIFIGVRP